uniref:(northern house mosquito) hypothetical protein n=1 Tax=Culex pipiens TaxID=7175 RepID=A0A8D8E2D2_CULPI
MGITVEVFPERGTLTIYQAFVKKLATSLYRFSFLTLVFFFSVGHTCSQCFFSIVSLNRHDFPAVYHCTDFWISFKIHNPMPNDLPRSSQKVIKVYPHRAQFLLQP